LAAFRLPVGAVRRLLQRTAALGSLLALPALGQGTTTGTWLRGTAYAPLGADSLADTLAPPVSREFRAVWLATVSNIDWPSRPGLPADSQKLELLALLDRAAALRLNAVIFQVRPAADALYKSDIEPWSYFLTGRQGQAPKPYYDPLAFAVEEAHKRGLELHAWFNPYRAKHPDDKTGYTAPTHVSRRLPRLVKKYGPYLWMDPGEPAVRRLTTRVVLDVVRRYDIDGVHIDDYFYPYRERDRRRREIPFPDERSWRAYVKGGGKLARDDWRRDNVNQLVKELYDGVRSTKPWVKFGISPFGIWRPGSPPNVSGLDAYAELYADSRRWIQEGWIDYFTPQIYFRLAAPQQPYADLLRWWREQNTHHRHLWPGNFTSRASARQTTWPAREILDQIVESRAQLAAVSGNVHFSMDAFMENRDSLVERLVAGPYAAPALVPASPWLEPGVPAVPGVRAEVASDGLELAIAPGDTADAPPRPPVRRPAPADRTRAPGGGERLQRVKDAEWWVIRYRATGGWRAVIVHADAKSVRLARDVGGMLPSYVTVTAVDRAGAESLPVVVTVPAPANGAR
jgi:uncharacterized lipoprotein YddW (UPF0748 family)